ncbi:MAG: acylneuraminate cytidylyltransferase family protein [Candidatus Methanomethylicaceae archaeon]
MADTIKVLGLIPARGGSKGVPKKNIQLLGGKPLIAYTIEVSRQAKKLTRTIVSTEDPEVARIAREWGGEVPFLRPPELATDNALSIDVAIHALLTIEEQDPTIRYDALMLLQPTTPFRIPQDIDQAIDILLETGADSVISVSDVGGHHPARMKYLQDGRLIDPPFAEEYENQPRQELVPMYIRSGAIYLTRRDVLLNRSFKGKDSRAIITPPERAVNIDTWMDFKFAEFLLQYGSHSHR